MTPLPNGVAKQGLRAVIAIPVRDEEEHLTACLEALAAQHDAQGRALPADAYGIVLLLNNCRDGSATLARKIAKTFPSRLRVVERRLAPSLAHAGGARRLAMDLAAGWMSETGHDGLLLTTDADTRVDGSWIAANLAAIAAGADAVAGAIALDPQDEKLLPDLLHQRGRLEAAYGAQLIEIAALLDPQSHNPWPHHATASGASLAVTLSAYRRIGGLPALPLGEDKALVAALHAQDARVRFAPEVRVITSGRLFGRARGGTADTMRMRSQDPTALCDETLEPLASAVTRARWRGRLRRLHAQGRFNAQGWSGPLGLTRSSAIDPAGFGRFGLAWSRIEQASPLFQRRRLSPAELPHQIRQADATLTRLRRSSPPRDDIEPEPLSPLLMDQGCEGVQSS